MMEAETTFETSVKFYHTLHGTITEKTAIFKATFFERIDQRGGARAPSAPHLVPL